MALGIMSLLVFSIFSLSMGSLSFYGYAQTRQEAGELLQEAVIALGSISQEDWSSLVFERSAITRASGRWSLLGEGTVEQIGNFTRTIDFQDIYRDVDGNVVEITANGAVLDVATKRAIIEITWKSEKGVASILSKTIYLVTS